MASLAAAVVVVVATVVVIAAADDHVDAIVSVVYASHLQFAACAYLASYQYFLFKCYNKKTHKI